MTILIVKNIDLIKRWYQIKSQSGLSMRNLIQNDIAKDGKDTIVVGRRLQA